MTIERAFASAAFTLDQTVDTLVGGMTLSPAAGSYLAVFNCELTSGAVATNGHVTTFSVFVDGVQIPHTEREFAEDSSEDEATLPMVVTCEVNPTAGQAVEVRYRTSDATTPLSADKREFNLFPIAGVAFEDTATGDDTLNSATFTTLGSMTRTPPADDYLLVFSTSARGPSGNKLEFRVSVGGTPVSAARVRMFQESSIPEREQPVLLVASISPNGAEVVEIEWARTVGSGTITAHERTMNLVETPPGDIFVATGTADDADNTAADKQIDDMLITDPGVADYLTLFASTDFFATIGVDGDVTYSVRVAGVQVADSTRRHMHESSIDDTDLPVIVGARVTTALSTDDIQMFWQGTGSNTRTIFDRTLIAIREPVALDQIIAMDELTLASSPEALTPVGGAVVVPMNELTLAGSPEAFAVIPGGVIVAMAELSLVSSPEALTPIGGPVTVVMDELILASIIENVGVVPGGIAIGMQELLLAVSAETFNLAADRFIDMDSLTLVGSAETLTPVGGPVSVSMDELTLVGSAETLIPSKVVFMDELSLASSPEALAVVPGPVVIPMDELTLSSAPQFLSPLGGPVTIVMDEVVLVGSAEFLGDVGLLVTVKKQVKLKGKFQGTIDLKGSIT